MVEHRSSQGKWGNVLKIQMANAIKMCLSIKNIYESKEQVMALRIKQELGMEKRREEKFNCLNVS